jgi:glycosyltransferase involved in cell wall biosynthesis
MIPRVCVVSALYHPDLGGLGRQAQLLSERLREEGVELFVIARKMEVEGRAAFSPSVEVVRVPSLFPKHHILEEIGLKNILISVIFSLGCLGVLIRRRKSYDLVHFHGASVPLFVALPFLKWMGKKAVAKVAAANLGTEAGSLSGKYGFIGNLLSRLVRRVDAFVAISEEIREGLLRDGIPPGRIYRIDNFVDASVFHPPAAGEKERLKEAFGYSGRMLVLFSGRMVRRKGVEHLLEAWTRVIREHPEARLLLLGEGPLLDDLRKMGAGLGIGDTAFIKGRVDNVPEHLRAADLFVLPSLQEGMPNALLEALACGLPAVATRIGGVVDIISREEDAVLVPPASPSGLADGINLLLSDPARREAMSLAAVSRSRLYHSMEARLPVYRLLYSNLLGSGGMP